MYAIPTIKMIETAIRLNLPILNWEHINPNDMIEYDLFGTAKLRLQAFEKENPKDCKDR